MKDRDHSNELWHLLLVALMAIIVVLLLGFASGQTSQVWIDNEPWQQLGTPP